MKDMDTLFLTCSMLLLIVGMYCLSTKRNMVKLVIAIEILINAANLTFIAFSSYRNPGFVDLLPQALTTLSITIAGCVTAIALTLVLNAYKHYKTLDARELRKLKG